MLNVPTDYLLFGVIVAIGINRVFQGSGLRLSRPIYVVVQVINLCFAVALTVLRISEFQDNANAELAIRVFLLCFVAWHMVRNSNSRTKALRQHEDAEASLDERRARVAAFEASQLAQAGEGVTSVGAEEAPESDS